MAYAVMASLNLLLAPRPVDAGRHVTGTWSTPVERTVKFDTGWILGEKLKMNYATLAPPITKENAAEYTRRATTARERNRAARKAAILASPDLHARKEVEREIYRTLDWMKKAKSREEHAALARTLDTLWSKAFPEVRATKPTTRRPPLPVAQDTWEPGRPDTATTEPS
ncbi:MAG TPA: hypothetical protein VNV43_04170 [Candidatus Acidoferrales bacterium]|nr:hypothetical protein [Candidatus Acidoferrales bacterium]